MSKVLYYHLNSFPEISQRDEYRLATSFGLHSPRFRYGFDNQLDLVKNPLPDNISAFQLPKKGLIDYCFKKDFKITSLLITGDKKNSKSLLK